MAATLQMVTARAASVTGVAVRARARAALVTVVVA
jgi:hypothetical protein